MTPYPQARILIVDDEESNVRYLTRVLGTEGYTQLFSTRDSSAAVHLFLEHDPDLVILDLMMPRPDGYDVMDALRPILTAQRVPAKALILTADDTAKRRCWERGDRDFMTKPVDLHELLGRVENLVEIRRQGVALARMQDNA